jgi:Reverse transcriptase (RNA-dependent DNA polymerase)
LALRRIEAGEGTADRNISVYANTNATTLTSSLADTEEAWAYFAGFDEDVAASIQDAVGNPKTVSEARSRHDWPDWKSTMGCKMASLDRALTWTTVLHQSGTNLVGCKWIFHLKRKADGSIDKYKARLVAQGFTQIYGVDYYDTYSPVARLASFRMVLALAARLDWEIKAFDFNSAYLNGELGEDKKIFMEEPPGYETGKGNVK